MIVHSFDAATTFLRHLLAQRLSKLENEPVAFAKQQSTEHAFLYVR
jgi:hypothetical protein